MESRLIPSTWMERFLDRFLKHKIIKNCNKEPYLSRWYFYRSPNFATYLHKFHRSDEDRALHDHPGSFISVILWRGYNEITEGLSGECPYCKGGSIMMFAPCSKCRGSGKKITYVKKRKWPGMILYRPATWRHRVELLRETVNPPNNWPYPNDKPLQIELPAWSMIIRFKQFRKWGFWPNGKFVNNEDWWQQHCED
jgi:hypothetical protein